MDYQLPPVAQNPQMNGLPVPVGVMQGTLTHVQAQVQDQEPHRWSQYQQLWRQHVYLNGKHLEITLQIRSHTLYVLTQT